MDGQAQSSPCWPQCGVLHPCDRASEPSAGRHVPPGGSWLIWPWPSGDPGRGAALSDPAPYSQAGVKSSGKALKGKCFSDVGPEIALPSPKLISSCLASQFCFRNKHLLALFALQPDSRSALRLCLPEEVASGHWGRGQKSPRGPSQVSRHWCLSRTERETSDWWPDLWSSSPPSLGSGYMRPQLQLKITSIVIIIAQASVWC